MSRSPSPTSSMSSGYGPTISQRRPSLPRLWGMGAEPKLSRQLKAASCRRKQSFSELLEEVKGLVEVSYSSSYLSSSPASGSPSSFSPLSSVESGLHWTGNGNGTGLVDMDQRELEQPEVQRYLNGARSQREVSLSGMRLNRVPGILMFSMSFRETLTSLDLSSTGLTSLDPKINLLQQLHSLVLHHNLLRSLPDSIGSLTRLQNLDLHKNKLRSLPTTVVLLLELRSLNLSHNRLRTLPMNLGLIPTLTKVKIGSNRHIDPRFLRANGSKVLDPLPVLGNQEGEWECGRVLLLGSKGVGKTEIAKRLQARSTVRSAIFEEVTGYCSSPALSVTAVQNENRCCFLWDFAETNLCGMHQLYLSQDTVYLIVFDLRRPDEEASNLSYWLHSTVARFPSHSRVILVGTHASDKRCSVSYIEGVFQRVTNAASQQVREAIHHCVAVDSVDGVNFDQLIACIDEQVALSSVRLTKPILSIKAQMYAIQSLNQSPLLSWNIVESVAAHCLPVVSRRKSSRIQEAIHVLESLGLFMAVRCGTFLGTCTRTVALEPAWLAQVVSTLTREGRHLAREGILTATDIAHIWTQAQLPSKMYGPLLHLLEVLDIAFQLPGDDCHSGDLLVLVPSLLPKVPVSPSPSPSSISSGIVSRIFKLEYSSYFMGKVIARVASVAQLQKRLWSIQRCWKNGIEMRIGGALVSIVLDDATCELELRADLSLLNTSIHGETFLMLLDAIETVLVDWLQVPCTVFVPCNHCISMGREFPRRFTWKDCEGVALRGETLLYCPGDLQPVKLSEVAPELVVGDYCKKYDPNCIVMNPNSRLGSGSFASVHRAQLKLSKDNVQEVAVKKFFLFEGSASAVQPEDVLQAFGKETRLMSCIQHDNVVSSLGWTRFLDGSFGILMEYMRLGSLYSLLQSVGAPSFSRTAWEFRFKVALDVAKGLEYLHGCNPPVIHRDLKSPNILLTIDKDGGVIAKIADFGTSRTLFLAPALTTCSVDNPTWLAPEVLQQHEYTEKADVYAVGVVLYELISGKGYFEDKKLFWKLQDAVIRGERPPLPEDYRGPEEYIHLMVACWADEPHLRPSTPELRARFEELWSKKDSLPVTEYFESTEPLDQGAPPKQPQDLSSGELSPLAMGSDPQRVSSRQLCRVSSRRKSIGPILQERIKMLLNSHNNHN